MEKKNYRDLVVWQRAIELVPKIYNITRRLPKEELYALGDQIRRAAVSIPANISEGQARQHGKEFIQYLFIAKGSLAELRTLLIVAQKLGYISSETLQQLEEEMSLIARPLEGLLASLRRS